MTSSALHWFKSSYSTNEGQACLEVAYTWRKSSYSSEEGGACVEVASCPHTIHIRDSKNPDGPAFQVGSAAWAAFLSAAR